MLASGKDTQVILGLVESLTLSSIFSITHSAPFVIPSVTLTFVFKSYIAPTAIETELYKPIVFVGSSGIFPLTLFFRSSDISPTMMSIHLI